MVGRQTWGTFQGTAAWTPRGRTGVRAQVPLKVVRPGGGVLAAGEGAHVHHRHCELQDELPSVPRNPRRGVMAVVTVLCGALS